MPSLEFIYGAMGSGKSANASMRHFNILERGKRVVMVKPRIDSRDSKKVVKSRIGLETPCIYFDELQGMNDYTISRYDFIIVDEAQFLTVEEVDFLGYLVDDLNIDVICYGLRSDFQGNLFDGSKRLIELADKISEIEAMCWCGEKATMNARINNNRVIKSGEQIVIGANNKYCSLCRKHWKSGDLGSN